MRQLFPATSFDKRSTLAETRQPRSGFSGVALFPRLAGQGLLLTTEYCTVGCVCDRTRTAFSRLSAPPSAVKVWYTCEAGAQVSGPYPPPATRLLHFVNKLGPVPLVHIQALLAHPDLSSSIPLFPPRTEALYLTSPSVSASPRRLVLNSPPRPVPSAAKVKSQGHFRFSPSRTSRPTWLVLLRQTSVSTSLRLQDAHQTLQIDALSLRA